MSQSDRKARVVVVMGVSGCGKSSVGRMAAEAWGAEFLDADDFHGVENRRKMASAIPLDDRDREPWLRDLRERILLHERAGLRLVLACSALKARYRRLLDADGKDTRVRFIWLDGSAELIRKRVESRKHEYMPPDLLASQFAILEKPEEALRLSIEDTPAELAGRILRELEEGAWA